MADAAGDERARKIGANEAVFRTVNEQIESLNRGLAEISDGTLHIVCECGKLDCAAPISAPISVYERVRSDPSLFLVVPGHELPSVESVVDQTDGYNVVRKDPGEPRRVAEETDPR
jgi:hypothetical protein